MTKILLLTFVALFIYSCMPSNNKDSNPVIPKRQYIEEKNLVKVITLKKTTFRKEMVSNGKLHASRKVNLRFKTNGTVEKLFVKNGQRISVNDTIAILNSFEQEQRYEQAKFRLDKASIDLQDALISLGYRLDDSEKIPENFMQIAKSKSSYSSAQSELKTAIYHLNLTTLTAPFQGIIADIKTKEFENTSGEVFCLLIDDTNFEVQFPVLETEISNISLHKSIKVIPFSTDKVFSGYITEINPIVNENGLIDIKALVQNTGNLMEGMNVKILIENEIKNQLVVPKGAVIQRDNQQVLFKYTKEGIACWTYVQTNFENSTSYAVIAHPDKGGKLKAGDTIIVSDNLNLAHESKVEVKW
ncbi:efflux RND transporter periplasmic adaptor subunit [Halosquirtibacter laminarini]|uniref:Efflux RND transporter periplasmic adaptor subunit n=1 Tax=Halosquirtibacter laminarini TaxID=3374600 RepID=A0AC61NJE1_9BACT|nr:efflux RND transporter periplasmic adaptor subunit [Prolixibacteraceae bacterium]